MSTINIPELIRELEQTAHLGYRDGLPMTTRDLCRHAATALRQQQDTNYRKITHRLGLLLIELGKKLTGGA